MSHAVTKPHIVVLGGGNGTSRLLQALKPLLQTGDIGSLHALVLNADDGGSTGRLREQYNVAAMGDLTKCLIALSDFHGDVRGEQFLKALDHRFDRGDFAGHTLRNMFLTALEMTAAAHPLPSAEEDELYQTGIDSGLAMMGRLLQIPKQSGVVPTTVRPLKQQVIVKKNGTEELIGEGQHFISHNVNLQADPSWQPGDVRVRFAEGDAPLNPRAAAVLERATHIIIAPGHTYGTILPALALPALQRVLAKHPAQITIVMPLLTTPRQTTGWSGEDFVRVYESYLGRSSDQVIGNTASANITLVPGQEWVRFTAKDHDYTLVCENLVSTTEQKAQAGDKVPRAIVIHDAKKVQEAIKEIL